MTRPSPRLRTLALSTLACLGACSTAAVGDPVPAAFVVETLEQRLLDARTLDFDFHITAEGAVEADLRGTCSIGPADAVLRAEGEFATRPLEIAMTTTRDKVLGHTADRPIDTERGPELREALVIGLVRMGLLHNVAKLWSGDGPDHREGGVADWVRVVDIFAQRDGTLSMRLLVDDQDSGEAVLTLDKDGWPSVREQKVDFDEGSMRVVERYSQFRVITATPDR